MRPFALLAALCLALGTGCAASRAPLRAELPALTLAQAETPPPPPPLLTENHFSGDRSGRISEPALREVLEAPVFLETNARIGVVPVAGRYTPDPGVPLPGVPAALADALSTSGEFELAFEVSTDFPADRGISGLRELAARYRADYLLVYRHRFVERDYLNAWAWGYLTGVGALFLPGNTVEAAGVLEATLFDVKTGTLLFTVNERVHDERRVNNWHVALKTDELKRRMLETSTQKLADQVLAKVTRLVAARDRVPGLKKGRDAAVTTVPRFEVSPMTTAGIAPVVHPR